MKYLIVVLLLVSSLFAQNNDKVAFGIDIAGGIYKMENPFHLSDYVDDSGWELYPELGLFFESSGLEVFSKVGFIYKKLVKDNWEQNNEYYSKTTKIMILPVSAGVKISPLEFLNNYSIFSPYLVVALKMYFPIYNDSHYFNTDGLSITPGLGVNINFTHNLSIYGETKYNYGLEQNTFDGFIVLIGAQFKR